MNILVFSDSHGDASLMNQIIAKGNVDAVFFLGDNCKDAKELAYKYRDIEFSIVAGNCDFISLMPKILIKE